MPLFQVNYQDARRSPAMAAPQAYQQTDAILQEMEQRSQMMDLRERDMELSQMRALDFQQRQQQAAALDAQEFDAELEWRGMRSRQEASKFLSENGHLANYFDPRDLAALDGMDASEPGYWDLLNQAQIAAQQRYQAAGLRGMAAEAKELGVDEQVEGYLAEGRMDLADEALEVARRDAIRTNASVSYVSKLADGYRQSIDLSKIPSDEAISVNLLLSELEQIGKRGLREGDMERITKIREDLDLRAAPESVQKAMLQMQQEKEALTRRVAELSGSGEPPDPRKVPGSGGTFEANMDEKGQQTVDEQAKNRALRAELEARKKAGLENKPIEIAPEIQEEVDSGKIKWRGNRNLQ